ncbi:cysteine desulfurase family protein [Akkermansia sp.]|uniref:cysteine desulfurase family protein n=1 Tax=Akkermansia sp. TaxID=1872421 RepID=UPI003AF99EBB
MTPSRDWGSYEGVIYWDNNATTPLDPEVYAAMEPFLKERFFNPSAGYGCAGSVREAVEEARADVAALLGALPSEIVFTSGGTEATNMAFRQMAGERNGGIGVLSTDHDASLKTAVALGQGRVCPVDREGRAVPEEWEAMCAAGVSGVSFAWANNETGALQEEAALCSAARRHGASVHLDMVQCAGKIPVDLHGMEVDYASVSAHKFHGPKGAGCLYRRSGAGFSPLLFGGGQEHGLRSGTENVPGIIGFGAAARAALRHLEEDAGRLARLRDSFESLLRAQVDGVTVHSGGMERIPNTSNLAFDGCTAEALMLLLEPAGLLCSAGSACHTLQPMPSHVLTAMGLPDGAVRSSLRFSLSFMTTQEEVEQAVSLVAAAVRKVRGVQSSRTGPVLVYKP